MEVSWKHTTLVGRSWGHEEVEGLFFIVATFLDQSLVNDATVGWVHEATTLVLDKEALCDSLVDDNERDLRRSSSLVLVHVADGSLELWDLFCEANVSLGVSKSISVDEEVGWEFSLVLGGKDVDGVLDGVDHIFLNDLLALLLH